MVDICKCVNEDCPIRLNCYRFICKSGEYRQAWTKFNYNEETKSCDHLIKCEGD